MTTTVTSEYALVDVAHVHPHPRNVRRQVAGVDELAASIRAGGLHQPLVVAQGAPDGGRDGYTLVMGHRRLAAVQSLDWDEVPCIIRHDLDTEASVLEAMLAENVARADLTVTEEGDAVQALLDLDVKPARIAKAVGRTPKHVRDRAQIAALSPKARDAVDDGQISITDALHLAKLDTDPDTAAKVEAAIGTNDFRYQLENAIQKSAFERKRAAMIAELERAGVTVTDDAAEAGVDEVRIFLDRRPDDPTADGVSVYVPGARGYYGTPPREQWIEIRPRAEDDPEGGSTLVETTSDEGDDDAADEARRAAAEAQRVAEFRARQEERAERDTARAARHRWLHEQWNVDFPAASADAVEALLAEVVSIREINYSFDDARLRLAPLLVEPDSRTKLSEEDPVLDPSGWTTKQLAVATWWIHCGERADLNAAICAADRWFNETPRFFEVLRDLGYHLSDLE